MNAGMPVQQAQGLALEAMAQAALELAAEVGRIQAHGATRVAVLTVPDIADSIFGRAPEQALVRPLIAAMVQTFNGTLVAALAGTPAKIIDTYAQSKDLMANPGQVRRESSSTCPHAMPVLIAAVTLGPGARWLEPVLLAADAGGACSPRSPSCSPTASTRRRSGI